ncbi:hypothetical protein SAMN05421780_11041 [Flexibacter flexilis DSM 6793]|uniref:SH3 domain-containing protein n=1 Tax=Flexibacter flexilis DSM 6793 TaxID=927664 RepID=A0A1I1MDJ1_9BACT|nr:hypothetical protein [Flexibacter flexilis]SFC80723.1 hypothetical protein SAMN05421780_11041 [Flexibacter flexilis DSM 6793]
MAKNNNRATPEVWISRGLGIAAYLAVVGGGGILLYKAVKSGVNGNTAAPATPTTTSNPTKPSTSGSSSGGSSLPAGTWPVKYGDKNLKVKEMQKAILALGGSPAALISASGGADGVFGDGTYNALKLLGMGNTVAQADFTRILAGAVAPQTQAALPASTTASTSNMADSRYVDEVDNFFFANKYAVAKTATSVKMKPYAESTTLASFSTGQKIGNLLGISTDIKPGDSSTRWAKIRLSDNRTGWVFSGAINSIDREDLLQAAFGSSPRPSGAQAAYVGMSGLPEKMVVLDRTAYVWNEAHNASELLPSNTAIGKLLSVDDNTGTVLAVADNGIKTSTELANVIFWDIIDG